MIYKPYVNPLKAFGQLDPANGAVGGMSGASLNVASIVRNTTGGYTVTFTTPMQSANYCVVILGLAGNIKPIGYVFATKTAGSFRIDGRDYAGTLTDGGFSFTVHE